MDIISVFEQMSMQFLLINQQDGRTGALRRFIVTASLGNAMQRGGAQTLAA
jgi:hypothetical protein